MLKLLPFSFGRVWIEFLHSISSHIEITPEGSKYITSIYNSNLKSKFSVVVNVNRTGELKWTNRQTLD